MIGVDVVVIDRIEKMMDRWGEKALQRFLSKKEIALVTSASSAAGFWAAKEAASKAIGTGIGAQCAFHDLKISKTKLGQPVLKYRKRLRKKFNINHCSLSITHDGGLAIAVVALR
ncbi:MAG: holo-ACP synthase [Campylobacterota bacterium]|nr:holo-ACP synthase [Campylobacterota bacterium]